MPFHPIASVSSAEAEAGPSSSSSPSPSRPAYTINHRYIHAKNRQPLTVRYVGPLPPDAGAGGNGQLWIGVEYDDPTYGKHPGIYKDVQVFKCRQKGSGAFIKLPPGGLAGPLIKGKTMVESIEDRYGSLLPPTAKPELDDGLYQGRSRGEDEGKETLKLELGSSGIVVEAPGLSSVQARVGRLEKLRNMGFDEDHIASLGGEGEGALRDTLRKRLKGVKWLNLSRNLIPTWEGVAEIVSHFEGLAILNLNHSRFEPIDLSLEQREHFRKAFAGIKELHLSACLVTWREVCRISALFPALESLHLEDNPLGGLSFSSASASDPKSSEEKGMFDQLKELNLARCPLSDWTDIVSALSALPRLESLDLSWTELESIPPCPPPQEPSRPLKLKQLNLLNTRLSKWTDIDHLDLWTYSALIALRLSQQTQTKNDDDDGFGDERRKNSPTDADLLTLSGGKQDRPIIIATLTALVSFNSSPVSEAERRDAELYYLSYVFKYVAERGGKAEEWARYEELSLKHGRKLESSANQLTKSENRDRGTGLQSKMITLHIYPAPDTLLAFSPGETIKVLPSSPVSLLRKKIAKKLGKQVDDIRLWTVREIADCPGSGPGEAGSTNKGEGEGEGAKRYEIGIHITHDPHLPANERDRDGDTHEEREVGWWFDHGDMVMVSTSDEVEGLLQAVGRRA